MIMCEMISKYVQKTDVKIFVESKLCLSDRHAVHQLRELTSHRNGFSQACYEAVAYLLIFMLRFELFNPTSS